MMTQASCAPSASPPFGMAYGCQMTRRRLGCALHTPTKDSTPRITVRTSSDCRGRGRLAGVTKDGNNESTHCDCRMELGIGEPGCLIHPSPRADVHEHWWRVAVAGDGAVSVAVQGVMADGSCLWSVCWVPKRALGSENARPRDGNESPKERKKEITNHDYHLEHGIGEPGCLIQFIPSPRTNVHGIGGVMPRAERCL